jgi:hypothetical protein
VDLRGLIDDLVHRDKAKRHLPPVDDRAEAGARSTNRHAGQRRFGNWRRADPLGAELPEQRRNGVGRHVEDLGIAPHLLGDRFERGLVVRQLSHRLLLPHQTAKNNIVIPGAEQSEAARNP